MFEERRLKPSFRVTIGKSRLLWWNNTTNRFPNSPKDAYAALGRWDNNIFIAPSLDLVVIRRSDLEPAKDHKIAEYYQLVCDAVQKP